jgi:hypothetical protein
MMKSEKKNVKKKMMSTHINFSNLLSQRLFTLRIYLANMEMGKRRNSCLLLVE